MTNSQDPPLPFYMHGGVKVWNAERWFPTHSNPNAQVIFRPRERDRVTEIAIHHDAVPFEGGDQNFNGLTWDEERQRMQASYNYHTRFYPDSRPAGAGGWNWPGMGYHHYVFPSGRVYEVGRLSTVRAHVAFRNTPTVGVVIASSFMNAPPPIGSLLAAALSCVYIWDWAGRVLPITAHQVLAVPGWETACPGDTHRVFLPQIREAAQAIARGPAVDPNIRIRAALTPAWNAGQWQRLYNQLRFIGFR